MIPLKRTVAVWCSSIDGLVEHKLCGSSSPKVFCSCLKSFKLVMIRKKGTRLCIYASRCIWGLLATQWWECLCRPMIIAKTPTMDMWEPEMCHRAMEDGTKQAPEAEDLGVYVGVISVVAPFNRILHLSSLLWLFRIGNKIKVWSTEALWR